MISDNTNFEGIDPITVEAFRALHRTFHLHKQLLDRALARKGSHPPEAMCLRVLAARQRVEPEGDTWSAKGMSQKELADRLHLSRPRVTALLQELEAAGFVSRQVDDRDQRITRVSLTEAGLRRARELEEAFVSVFGETLGAMSEEQRQELQRLLTILADCAEQALRVAQEKGKA
ncbi:MAG: MarR family transcriptional regulator [Thermoleophilia bacterium]|nr:MarR family transcriptional regulator [Thermoleophilia bacterium]